MRKVHKFFKGLRSANVVLLGLAVAQMLNIEVNMVLFAFVFFMFTFPLDILFDNLDVIKAEKDFRKRSRKRKELAKVVK